MPAFPLKNINPVTGQPWKILLFGDLVALTGFGRIGNEVGRRLKQRGYDVQAAGIGYTGWPLKASEFPFHVWPVVADLWVTLAGIVQQTQPDLILSYQDFPYHKTIWEACRIDFSRIRWVFITPIDGTPVHPDWVKLCAHPDGMMTISRFGVEALRQAGVKASLCHPGVDSGEFYPADAEEKLILRQSAGYADDEFIVGVVCMNQGRKAIPSMIEAFHEFAKDKPEARLLLDLDPVAPAGWDVPALLRQMGWTDEEQKRVKYRPDLFRGADGKQNDVMLPLRNRYALMDAHMVISHREGFGLPLLESMACGVPTLALDWCSGPEIVGEGRGFLVRRLSYMEYGTWGGARDAFPDVPHITEHLNFIHSHPTEAAGIAAVGYEWARRQTWDVTADQVENVISAALSRKKELSHAEPVSASPNPAPDLADVFGPGGGSDPAPAGTLSGDPGLQ